MGKIIPGKIFDPVFKHIAHYQGYKQGHGIIAKFLLYRKRDHRSKDHGNSSGQAIEKLLGYHPVFTFIDIQK